MSSWCHSTGLAWSKTSATSGPGILCFHQGVATPQCEDVLPGPSIFQIQVPSPEGGARETGVVIPSSGHSGFDLKGSAANRGRKWPVACPQTQAHTGILPASPLQEPQSVIAGPPSAMSHHPFGLGWAKNLSLEQVSQEGHPRLLAQEPHSEAFSAGGFSKHCRFFPGPEAFLSTPPPTRSFTSGCQRGGTSSTSPGSWKIPRRAD